MGTSFDLDKIKDLLKEVTSRTAEIEGAALVSYDGIMIANALQRDSPQEIVAAITATLLNLGKLSVEVLQLGNLEQVFIKCQSGYIVIGRAGDTNVVTLIAKRDAKLGILINETNKAAEDLLKVLGEAPKKRIQK
jgi:predicted regulator of Ras-like GTPase activity (Roadblock/LC7/MglB family)